MAQGTGRLRAGAAALGGAALLGLTPILVRISELGPQATNLWRFLFALPILALWLGASRRPGPAPAQLAWLALAGLLFGTELSLWAAAVHLTTVVNATLLSNMTPLFAALLGWLLLRERLGGRVLAGGAVALAGALMLAAARAGAGAGPAPSVAEGWLGDALGFASAAGYAGYLLIVRWLGTRVSTAAVMFWATATAALYAFAAALVMGEPLTPQSWRGWATLIVLGAVVHTGAQGLIAFSVARLPIVVSTVTLWMQPLVAALISWIWFGEALGPLALAGAALILAGVFAVQRARS